MKKPELILPAGSLEKLKIGYQYGGDVCYIGLPPFSLRARENKFDEEDLREAFKIAREAGKKLYVTCNIFPKNSKIEAFKKHMQLLSELKPDALICADPGVISIVKEFYPDARIHLSVQANTLNYRSVQFWKEQGIARVILPRELTLAEIREIHEKVPDVELECFVHGAICVAYSGRCLLSFYMNTRDSNQGVCAQSCRWKYKVLEEEKRPGEYMPIEEDEQGSYILNSKDLCALPHLKELMEAGVCGFKVEGRSKTVYYLSHVAKAYREGIDDMFDGNDFDESLLELVGKTANRSFIPGYLMKPFSEDSIYYDSNAPLAEYEFVGVVCGQSLNGRDDLYEIEVRNRILKGSEIEVMTPDSDFSQVVSEMFSLEGEEIDAAHGGHKNIFIKIDRGVPLGTILRQKRN